MLALPKAATFCATGFQESYESLRQAIVCLGEELAYPIHLHPDDLARATVSLDLLIALDGAGVPHPPGEIADQLATVVSAGSAADWADWDDFVREVDTELAWIRIRPAPHRRPFLPHRGGVTQSLADTRPSVFGRPYCPNPDCRLPYRRVGDGWAPSCRCPAPPRTDEEGDNAC